MKTIYKSSLLLLAAILFLPAAMKGQNTPVTFPNPEGVVVNKTLTRTADNQFEIMMEAYVSGHTNQQTTVEHMPLDIVLVLDASAQMSSQYVTGNPQYYDVSNAFTTQGLGGRLPNLKPVSITERTTDLEYFFKDGDHYYQLHSYVQSLSLAGILPEWTRCSVYYVKDGVNYYLRPDTPVPTTEQYTIGETWARYQVIYNGTLYRQVNTKLQAEKTAASAFIDAIRKDAIDNNVDHQISIVKFAGNFYGRSSAEANLDEGNHDGYTEVVKNFIHVKESTTVEDQPVPNSEILKEAIDAIAASGAAYANRGMRKAQVLISNQNGIKNDGHQKLVVFFTGSIPDDKTTNPSFDETIANGAITYSWQLKNNASSAYGSNVTVYTVGLFAENEATGYIPNYMNGVSSNYPTATAYTALGTGDSNKGYYQASSDGNIISLIQNLLVKTNEEISGGSTYNLGTTAHIMDFVTSDFQMLGETVTVKTAQCKTMSSDGTPTEWYAEQDVQGVTVAANPTNKSVDVYGFDFNSNYVGMDKIQGRDEPHLGKKLIVRFPVQIDPSSEGGIDVPSNLETSGIYVMDNGNLVPVSGFNVPTVDLPNIIISKTGLKAGESALFNVYKKTGDTYGNPIQVWVTGDGENAATTTVKYLEPGTYKVEETGWSWSYDTDTTSQEEAIGTKDNTTFSFENTPKTGTPAHGEAATGNNVFAK